MEKKTDKKTEKKTVAKKTAPKEKKQKKEKAEKKLPFSKLPSLFKKSFTQKKFDSKILKKIYIQSDRENVSSLFVKGANPKKVELLAVPRDKTFTKKEILKYKTLAKEIKGQKGRFKLLPLVAVVAFCAVVGIVVTTFKNPIAAKIIRSGCESAFGAKTDVGKVNLEIFGTSLTVENLAVGNKDDVMKNLFEAQKIEVAFSLTRALRGKFDAQNLEVSGIAFGTERKSSCELPAKAKKEKKQKAEQKDSAFMTSLKAKSDSAIENLKSETASMLGGTDVESIVANVQSQLKTQAASEQAVAQSKEMIAKWQSKPAEIKTQVDSFSSSVSELQSLNVSNIKDVQSLKNALAKIDSAINQGRNLQKTMTSVSGEIKTDSQTVQSLAASVQEAVKHDTDFAAQKLSSAADAFKNAGNIFNSALDSIGYGVLGKYYPYLKKGLDMVSQMKSDSARRAGTSDKKKEAKRKESNRRLPGTTFWFGSQSPAFLIERAYVSGEGFSAEANFITSDQDLLGKPSSANGKFVYSGVTHSADLVVDARSYSKEPLIAVEYSGKGFPLEVDGTKIAVSSGIPSVSGTASVSLKGSAGKDTFAASGRVGVNPVKLTSDGFSSETVTKYYNQALSSVSRLDLGYSAAFTEAAGVNLALTGNFADQFAKALETAARSIGSDAKNAALAKINASIKESSGGALAKVNEFMGIKGDIDLQNTNLSDIQKKLDAKRAEIEKRIQDSAKSAVGDALKGATSGSVKNLFGTLKQ